MQQTNVFFYTYLYALVLIEDILNKRGLNVIAYISNKIECPVKMNDRAIFSSSDDF